MSTGKKIAVAAAAALALLSVPFVFLLMMVFAVSGGAAASDACLERVGTSPGVVIADAGGPVRIPIVGRFKVMSEFNPDRVDPVDGVVRAHKGIDLSGIPGSGPIVAMKAGVVTRTYVEPWGANTVEIDHGAGLTSRYLHLARWTVSPGQHVAVGQQIGIEGTTGHSTGVHLHWEIRQDGQLVNPRDWAKAQGFTLPPTRGQGDAGPAPLTVAPTSPASTPLTSLATPGATATASAPIEIPEQVGAWRRPQLKVAEAILAEGRARGLDVWTRTVAVMTSMGESSLTPVDHGDAVRNDTVGPFQQGPEWGPLAVRMDPAGAAGLFYEALLKVPNYHQLAPTIAANKTQRNADPWHYAKFWDDAVKVVTAVDGSTPDATSLTGADPVAAACQEALAPNGDLPSSPGTPTLSGSPGASRTSSATPKTNAPSVVSPAPAPALPEPPATTCPPTRYNAERGASAVVSKVLRCSEVAFPQLRGGTSAGTPAVVTLQIEVYRSSAGRQAGWTAARWLQANAAALGVSAIVYDAKMWDTAHASDGWRPYRPFGWAIDDTVARRDHIEIRTS